MLTPADLHDYQEESIAHIQRNRRCALWAPMGSGKTVSTLTALEELSAVEDVYPVLCLAPKRVAISTWPAEPARWSHLKHLRVSTVVGTESERKRALAVEADVFTCTYDLLSWLVDYLGDSWPFKTVVADESTKLKSFRLRQGGKRAQSLAKVAHTKVDRFLELTGTPAANGLKDLWGSTYFLDKGSRLGRTYTDFEQRWFRRSYDGYSLEPMPHAQREIEGRLKDVCLTIKGLPVDEPVVRPVYVDLGSAAREVYRQMEREMFVWLEKNGVEAVNAAVKTGKLLQICNGALYTDDDHNWSLIHDYKIEALDSIVEEANGAPVLVSYNFRSDLERLRKHFKHARVLDAKPDTIKRWNEGGIQMLLAHPACLHPRTEVLTEFRGWVPIVRVRPDERVFDGVEFVGHKGCSFSGVKKVTDLFGIVLTPDHKLLVDGVWAEAKDVRDCEGTKRKARYTYAGDDPYLGSMLPLRGGEQSVKTECRESQPRAAEALPGVCGRDISPDDGYSVLVDLEGHEKSCDKSRRSGLQAVRSYRAADIGFVAHVRELLSRHVLYVQRWLDDRADEQRAGIQQAELSLGYQHGAAGQQNEQPRGALPRTRYAPRRVLSHRWGEPGSHIPAAESRYVGRGSPERLRSFDVQEGPQISFSEVYDLVDCGPRNRFVIRNADGDVFISHNSAGHGLNLADGGNILARFSADWNLELWMQILERIGPMRQAQAGYDRPVFDYPILVRDTLDEVVYERIGSKRSVQEALLIAMQRRKEQVG